MSQPALLIIDLLNDFFQDGPLLDQRTSLVNSVNQLIRLFRANSLPIIWVRQEFSADLSDAFPETRKKGLRVTIAGTEGAKLLNDLEHRPGDYEVINSSCYLETIQEKPSYFSPRIARIFANLLKNPREFAKFAAEVWFFTRWQ